MLASLLPWNPRTGAGAVAGVVVAAVTVAWVTASMASFASLLPGAPGWFQDLNGASGRCW